MLLFQVNIYELLDRALRRGLHVDINLDGVWLGDIYNLNADTTKGTAYNETMCPSAINEKSSHIDDLRSAGTKTVIKDTSPLSSGTTKNFLFLVFTMAWSRPNDAKPKLSFEYTSSSRRILSALEESTAHLCNVFGREETQLSFSVAEESSIRAK